MHLVPADDRERDELSGRLERAVEQALDLRQTIVDLRQSDLRLLMDVLLLEIGRRIAALERERLLHPGQYRR